MQGQGASRRPIGFEVNYKIDGNVIKMIKVNESVTTKVYTSKYDGRSPTFWSRRQTKVYENIDFKIVQLNYYKISLSLDSNVLPFRTFKR